MTKEVFKSSIAGSLPPGGIDDYLKALWYDAKGDWEGSHHTVQDLAGPKAAWIHAYLHRKEGDPSNAAYWYNKAGRKMPGKSLENEWEEILEEMLD